MTSLFTNVFTNEQIDMIYQLSKEAKEKLSSMKEVRFSIELTPEMKQSLASSFNIDMSGVSEIPMRWIKGDTKPHVDVGTSQFENTYLVYMNDNQGNFVINDTAHPIDANSGFKFKEGVPHFTTNTGEIPRLLLGPINEFIEPVGAFIVYFQSELDAINNNGGGILGYGGSYTVDGLELGYTYWRIQSSTNGGGSPENVTYQNGDTLISNGGTYFMYPASTCFLEGSKILSLVNGKEEYIPIETLQKGDLVKTSKGGYKQIKVIGKGTIVNSGGSERIEERLYKCSRDNYPELTEDLFLTGYHSILVDKLTDVQREKTIKSMGKIYLTEGKSRLIAYADERAEPWCSEGKFNVWHLALENEDKRMNYGIYANGGLLVESCSIAYLTDYSNMAI